MRCLEHFDNLWLRTLEDGRIVLIGQKGNVHWLALLSAIPFLPNAPVTVEGATSGVGRVQVPPAIRFGQITVGIDKKVGPNARIIAPVAYTTELFTDKWPGLKECSKPEGDTHDEQPSAD
jgi:hypothetical protein